MSSAQTAREAEAVNADGINCASYALRNTSNCANSAAKSAIQRGNNMDTFIDKLAQKRNAQEMIRANSAAEAAKMAQMQNQLKSYDEIMQEIRRVNLKTSENVENVNKVLAECMEKLDGLKTEKKDAENVEQELAAIKALLEERFSQSEDFMHKENVKVYRNVQAALTEELTKQTEQTRVAKGRGTPLWLSIVILVAVAADIAVTLVPLVLGMMNYKLF